VVPVRTDEEAVPFSEGQQSKRVRIEPSMPEAMGNQGPDYKSIPSTVHSNAGQWIPSTVHSNAGQWNHAHFPVVDNPYFNPEETSHYLSSHTEIPGFYSTPIIPEHSWPAGVYNDPGDANWIDTLLNSSQELVGKDVFHEQTDNSQQLNEKFANQFLHLHQLDRDDETDNHFANFDNQPLMPNTYFHRTDPNQDLDFVASLNVSPSSSSYLHTLELLSNSPQKEVVKVKGNQVFHQYQQKFEDEIQKRYLEFVRLPLNPLIQVKKILQEKPLFMLIVTLDGANSADHTSFIAPSDSEGLIYQFDIFLHTFQDLLAEILNIFQLPQITSLQIRLLAPLITTIQNSWSGFLKRFSLQIMTYLSWGKKSSRFLMIWNLIQLICRS
jgi:hypothetical protein